MFAVASVAGPLLGGFLVDNLSWRWVFYVNLPVGAVAVADRRHPAAPPHARAVRHRIDYLGAALLSGGVASLILLTTWGGNEYAWGSTTIVGLGSRRCRAAGACSSGRSAAPPSRSSRCSLFRSRVFNVANAMGFTIGMAMFGAIVFIPLFLQLVYGASPTSSGLRMLPLMAGLLVAAVVSGRVISRIGRYKPVPDRRHGDARRAACSCSRGSRVGTAPWLASVYMLVVGVGIGLVMQVLVLVVQNDARPEEIGVATSTATFFRSVGGSFGVAIFGAIFAVAARGRDRALPAARDRATRRRRPPDPGAGQRSCRPRCTPTSCRRSRNSLHGVFLLGMVLAIVPFVLSWLLQGGAAPHDARAGGRAERRRGRGRRDARGTLALRRFVVRPSVACPPSCTRSATHRSSA